VPPGLIFLLVFYTSFSCYCDVVVIIMVVCIMLLISNQYPIVLSINKDRTLSSSLRHCILNIYSLFKGIMRKSIIIIKLIKPGGSRAARKEIGDAFQRCTSSF